MILTQPNTLNIASFQMHTLDLPRCCPVSGNPQPGSKLYLSYMPGDHFIEVYSLRQDVYSYVNGRGDVRDMEGMIAMIARDCATAIQVPVLAWAYILLQRGDAMQIICLERPS